MRGLVLLGVTVLAVSAIAALLRRRLLLFLTDADFAAVAGVRVTRWMMLLALLHGAIIGGAVAAVGPLVTFGFLILPALTAVTFTRSLRVHLVGSMCVGAVVAVSGYHLAYRFDLPLGDCPVALAAALLIVVASGRKFAA